MDKRYWSEWIDDVLPGRVPKPRVSGMTMVIDTGLPMSTMRDLLVLAADHIDFWKFGFASASVCPPDRIQDKVALCQEFGIMAYPGGTSLEIAYAKGIWKDYLQAVWAGGIRAIEVSDGTIDLSLRSRRDMIRTAKKMGFTVLSEIGKKDVGHYLPVSQQAQIIHGDLNSGANYIVMEGREAGIGVGVYDGDGNVREDDMNALLETLGPLSTRLIWEAPLGKQQVYYVRKFGNRVNLGNVRPLDVPALESLRRGLRSDTLRLIYGTPADEVSHGEHASEGSALPGRTASVDSGAQPTLWTDRFARSTRPHRTSPRLNQNEG